MSSAVISGSLGGVMVSTLSWNAKDAGSISSLDPIFHIFITLHNTDCCDYDSVQAIRCMVVEPTLCMYMYSHCLYVCNSKH